MFIVNGTLDATFDTFSSNVARNNATPNVANDGTDVYVLSDGSDPGVASGAASVNLTDDILGQATAPYSDFVANNINGAG